MEYKEKLVVDKKIVSDQEQQILVCKLDLSAEFHSKALAEGIPTTLWLGISMHKEYPAVYRHAWGTAYVSTREDGGDRYPVETLRLRIEIPTLNNATLVDDRTSTNSAECSADCKYVGTIFGNFVSSWQAWATHPRFGTWTHFEKW